VAESVLQTVCYCRRLTTRFETTESVYALWSCEGRDGLSRVRDLSLGGLFIESHVEAGIGAPVKLDVLADEGQIRASAVVRHVRRGHGMGLKLIAINDQDCRRLAGFMKRLRTWAFL